MFGFQFYILLGTKRWGFHVVPFIWNMALKTDADSSVVMVGPFMFTAEIGVV